MFHPLWHLLLGNYCLLCRQAVKEGDGVRQLCRWCLASLPWQPSPELATPPPGISRVFAPLAYEGAAKRWVLDSKHEAGLVSARMLGNLLAEALEEAFPFPAERPNLLVPVPLSRRRLRARGHNQAVIIAQPVARRLRLPLAWRSASRRRHTPILAAFDQTQRRSEVAGAFVASSLPAGSRVAIIDDVVTTGATAAALAEALTKAGAVDVQLWAATSAPHPG